MRAGSACTRNSFIFRVNNSRPLTSSTSAMPLPSSSMLLSRWFSPRSRWCSSHSIIRCCLVLSQPYIRNACHHQTVKPCHRIASYTQVQARKQLPLCSHLGSGNRGRVNPTEKAQGNAKHHHHQILRQQLEELEQRCVCLDQHRCHAIDERGDHCDSWGSFFQPRDKAWWRKPGSRLAAKKSTAPHRAVSQSRRARSPGCTTPRTSTIFSMRDVSSDKPNCLRRGAATAAAAGAAAGAVAEGGGAVPPLAAVAMRRRVLPPLLGPVTSGECGGSVAGDAIVNQCTGGWLLSVIAVRQRVPRLRFTPGVGVSEIRKT